jgi:hypothetical protein
LVYGGLSNTARLSIAYEGIKALVIERAVVVNNLQQVLRRSWSRAVKRGGLAGVRVGGLS